MKLPILRLAILILFFSIITESSYSSDIPENEKELKNYYKFLENISSNPQKLQKSKTYLENNPDYRD